MSTEVGSRDIEVITPEIPIELNRENNLEQITSLPQHDEDAKVELASEFVEQAPLKILKDVVQPGELKELSWSAGQSFSGKAIKPSVLVVRGLKTGPTLCLIAAIHGDELNGIEIVRRVVRNLDPMEVNGTVIGVPIVNIFGFTGNTRYLPDRRDLNRYFPGNPDGSAASRIADRFFTQIINHCEYVVDFHTGSFKRNNLPQLRADMNVEKVREFVGHFGSVAVLHKSGHGKSLRAAATREGIPTVAFEMGQTGSLQEEYVESGIKTIDILIRNLNILKRFRLWFEPQPVYYGSRWVRVNSGGILISKVEIGSKVEKHDILGHIINPLTTEETEILAPFNGRILGIALNQFMLPGYAAFHIGISSDTYTMIKEEKSQVSEDDESDESDDELDDETEEPENGESLQAGEEEFH
ncbi:MAG: succinylglutamate desuccinylase/aspartoacylase family protein [Proteobacteria bacterium]|nr:succinylglutamate desuccinylase/aspartoacylase family protein [Pseudomonadota bacterium]